MHFTGASSLCLKENLVASSNMCHRICCAQKWAAIFVVSSSNWIGTQWLSCNFVDENRHAIGSDKESLHVFITAWLSSFAHATIAVSIDAGMYLEIVILLYDIIKREKIVSTRTYPLCLVSHIISHMIIESVIYLHKSWNSCPNFIPEGTYQSAPLKYKRNISDFALVQWT